jgi:hypothetical protein
MFGAQKMAANFLDQGLQLSIPRSLVEGSLTILGSTHPFFFNQTFALQWPIIGATTTAAKATPKRMRIKTS